MPRFGCGRRDKSLPLLRSGSKNLHMFQPPHSPQGLERGTGKGIRQTIRLIGGPGGRAGRGGWREPTFAAHGRSDLPTERGIAEMCVWGMSSAFVSQALAPW